MDVYAHREQRTDMRMQPGPLASASPIGPGGAQPGRPRGTPISAEDAPSANKSSSIHATSA